MWSNRSRSRDQPPVSMQIWSYTPPANRPYCTRARGVLLYRWCTCRGLRKMLCCFSGFCYSMLRVLSSLISRGDVLAAAGSTDLVLDFLCHTSVFLLLTVFMAWLCPVYWSGVQSSAEGSAVGVMVEFHKPADASQILHDSEKGQIQDYPQRGIRSRQSWWNAGDAGAFRQWQNNIAEHSQGREAAQSEEAAPRQDPVQQ